MPGEVNQAPIRPNEVVDITIRGARVVRTGQDDLGRAFIEYTHGEYNAAATVDRDDPSVTVERVAPAEWPPQPGDLWRDRNSRLHFAASYSPDYDDTEDSCGIDAEGVRVVLLSQGLDESCTPGHRMHRPEHVNQEYGPLTLVHREQVEPEGQVRDA